MKYFTLFGAASALSVTPVTKVIEMLKEMHTKGVESKAAEEQLHKEISDAVHKQLLDLSLDIGATKKTIKSEEATHLAETAKAEQLADEIAAMESEKAGFEKELSDQTKLRKKEKAVYTAEEADLADSVDALRRAVDTVKSQTAPTAMALVQKLAKTVPRAQKALDAFLQQPQAVTYSYEFQSGAILKLLKELEDKFTAELRKTQEEEANRAHAYALFKLDVDSEIENLKNGIAKANANESKCGCAAAEAAKLAEAAKQRLADLLADKASTESYMQNQDMTFTENQKVRADEIHALEQAIEILSGEDVSASAAKHLPTLLQAKAVSLLQLGSNAKVPASTQDSLLARANKVIAARNRIVFNSKSEVLSLVTTQMLTGGHFDKIVSMINDLIVRLESEAAAEKQHHEYCTTELKDNKLSRETYTTQVNALTAALDSLQAHISKLASDIKDYGVEAKTLKADMATAASTRAEQKDMNLATIADAQAAREALAQAMTILTKFYSEHSDEEEAEVALLQQSQKQMPEIESYQGQQNSKKGVMGMLEVIESDFARLEADTKAGETAAATSHEKYMTESTQARDDAIAAGQAAKVEKIQKEAKARRTTAELENAQTMLDAAIKYFEALKPQCIVQQVSPEERVQMRDQEVAALREALEILENHPDFTH